MIVALELEPMQFCVQWILCFTLFCAQLPIGHKPFKGEKILGHHHAEVTAKIRRPANKIPPSLTVHTGRGVVSCTFLKQKAVRRQRSHVNQCRNLSLLELLHFICASTRLHNTVCCHTVQPSRRQVRFRVMLLLHRHVWDPGARREAQAAAKAPCPGDVVCQGPQGQAQRTSEVARAWRALTLESSMMQAGSRHLEPTIPGGWGRGRDTCSYPHGSSTLAPQFVSIDMALEEEGYCQLWLNVIVRRSKKWFVVIVLRCSVLVCNYAVILRHTDTLINLVCACARAVSFEGCLYVRAKAS